LPENPGQAAERDCAHAQEQQKQLEKSRPIGLGLFFHFEELLLSKDG